MSKKRLLISAGILAILGVLVYLQVHSWRKFDWRIFWVQTKHVDLLKLLSAVVLIYVTYFLRALRWRIFLKPVKQDIAAHQLIAPTIIGFTGLALLGRPGEFIRPYLIARKTQLTVASQAGVWAVERIFDIAGYTVLLVLGLLFSRSLHESVYLHAFEKAELVLILLVVGLTTFAMLMWFRGRQVSAWVDGKFSRGPGSLGHHAAQKLLAFSEGLNTIHGVSAFLQISGISLLIWFVIGLVYMQVARSYGDVLSDLGLANVLILTLFSMVGSLVQLPAVGGGSQLAVIRALQVVFNVRPELAVSCGMLLWLVTFMSCVPAGLVLARREHVSLRKVSEESQAAEEGAG